MRGGIATAGSASAGGSAASGSRECNVEAGAVDSDGIGGRRPGFACCPQLPRVRPSAEHRQRTRALKIRLVMRILVLRKTRISGGS